MYMTTCLPSSSYFRRRTKGRALHLAVLTGSAVVLALVLASPAAYPGFQCNNWNWKNECTDFSYLDPRPAYTQSIGGYQTTVPSPQYFYHPVYTFPSTGYYNGYNYGNTYRCQSSSDCTGTVSVRVRGIPTVAVRGDQIIYTIYLRNDDSQYRTATVSAIIDPDLTIISASTGGYGQGNIVRWNSLRVAPGQSDTLTVTVRINANATLDGSNPYNPYGIPSAYPVIYPNNNLNLSQQQYQYLMNSGGYTNYNYPSYGYQGY